MALKNFFSKKTFFFIITIIAIIIILVFVFFAIKITTFKMPTKEIKIEDVKSINILSFNLHRRATYEKKLKSKFGNYFLGHKIGSDSRLPNICNGKKELIATNIINGRRVVYEDVKNKKDYSVFADGVWKFCSKYKQNECVYYSQSVNTFSERYVYFSNEIFNVLGCWFSHIRAIKRISKQPDNTYGLIFEDDFDISDNFNEDIKKALKEVPVDFDVLKLTINSTDISKKRKKLPFRSALKEKINSYIKNGYGKWIDLSVQKKLNSKLSYGTHAYLVSSQGARKILSFVRNNITLCLVDVDMFYYIPKLKNNIKAYFYTDNVPFILNKDNTKSTILLK